MQEEKVTKYWHQKGSSARDRECTQWISFGFDITENKWEFNPDGGPRGKTRGSLDIHAPQKIIAINPKLNIIET